MEKVTGIGGVFFKCQEPEKLAGWYRDCLGVNISFQHGAVFSWPEGQSPERPGSTTLGFFSLGSDYMSPSRSPFMLNFRVRDLDAMLEQLRSVGTRVMEDIEESDFGRFGWVLDPEGNKIELWEPPEGM